MISDEPFDDEVEEENYFVSMTDMMVGLVFIFLIMLMFYAVQFRDVTAELTGADKARTEILEAIQASLKGKGVQVTIDTQNGVLRLPDAILFAPGDPELRPDGKVAVSRLADALAEVLPCYTNPAPAAVPAGCKQSKFRIESLYIEGHTDTDRLSGGVGMRDNWDLSANRATNTYRAVIAARPDLLVRCVQKKDAQGKDAGCEQVLSVSGYGPQRPVDPASTPEAKQKNRRIDLRIIMVTPDAGATAEAVRTRLSKQ